MPIRSYRNYFLRGVCTCYASPISSMSYTCHRHVRSSDRIAAIFACLSACAPAIGLLIPNNRSSRIVPRPIYIYIYPRSLIFGSSPPRSCRIPSLSSYTIATKTVHSSIVNIIIILSFFFFIYTFFIIQTRFYLLFIYNLHAMSRRARSGESNSGGGHRPPRYLSIYPLSTRDFAFIFRSLFRTRKRSETANGRRVHAISGETDSREYFTETFAIPRRFRP